MTTNNPPSNGACVGKPNEWWFPDLLSRNPIDVRIKMRANADKAITICNACGVLEQCRNYALEWELHGIWGGMTERDRKDYRKKHNVVFRRVPPSEIVGPLRNA